MIMIDHRKKYFFQLMLSLTHKYFFEVEEELFFSNVDSTLSKYSNLSCMNSLVNPMCFLCTNMLFYMILTPLVAMESFLRILILKWELCLVKVSYALQV